MRTSRYFMIFAILIGCCVSSAIADDFTFSVPVALTKVDPTVQSVAVRCAVYDSTGNKLVGVTSGGVAPDANGNVNQTFVVSMNTTPTPPTAAVAYECGLSLNGTRGGYAFSKVTANLICPYGFKTGSVTYVSGTLPQQ